MKKLKTFEEYRLNEAKSSKTSANGFPLKKGPLYNVIVRDTGEVIMEEMPKNIALQMAAKKKGWIIQLADLNEDNYTDRMAARNNFLDFFGVPSDQWYRKFGGYKFDGKDDLKKLYKDLGNLATNLDGVKNYYRVATKGLNESVLNKFNQDILMDWIKDAEGKTVTFENIEEKSKPIKAKLQPADKKGLWKIDFLSINFKQEFSNPTIEIIDISKKVLHYAIEGGWEVKITK